MPITVSSKWMMVDEGNGEVTPPLEPRRHELLVAGVGEDNTPAAAVSTHMNFEGRREFSRHSVTVYIVWQMLLHTAWHLYCPWVSATITHLTCAVSDLLPLLPDLSLHFLQIQFPRCFFHPAGCFVCRMRYYVRLEYSLINPNRSSGGQTQLPCILGKVELVIQTGSWTGICNVSRLCHWY